MMSAQTSMATPERKRETTEDHLRGDSHMTSTKVGWGYHKSFVSEAA